MDHVITPNASQNRYCSTVTQSITINASPDAVWGQVGDFVGLAEWVVGVKKVEFISRTKRGLGMARRIWFDDGNKVVEYSTGWEDGIYISYIATSGLPLDGYHATISVLTKDGSSCVKWTSFLISDGSDKKQFEVFLADMESFYRNSLKNLKMKLEKAS